MSVVPDAATSSTSLAQAERVKQQQRPLLAVRADVLEVWCAPARATSTTAR